MAIKLKPEHVKQTWKAARKVAPIALIAVEAAFPASKTVRTLAKVAKMLF
jgi:hypothetical protein